MDLSEIGHSKLQGICDTLSEKVSCGISIMDTDGFIIASSRKDRIGSRHEAAAEVLKLLGPKEVQKVGAAMATISNVSKASSVV